MEPTTSTLKIVIVEDNASLADIYKTRLEVLGYQCFVAYDGEEGLAVIEREQPKLVLLDLMVPKMAGDQILATMRAHEWGRHIKVLIISNLNEADAPIGLRDFHIEGYVVKANITDDDLDRIVDSILKPEGQDEDVSLEGPTVAPPVMDARSQADKVDQPQAEIAIQPEPAPAVIPTQPQPAPVAAPLFSGIKSVIYPSANLAADKAFWQQATGIAPYFDQPYYVGFSVAGCELGLDPNAASAGITYPVSYWHVTDVKAATDQLLSAGAAVHAAAHDVGEGITMATFKDLEGNIFGIIDNPNSPA